MLGGPPVALEQAEGRSLAGCGARLRMAKLMMLKPLENPKRGAMSCGPEGANLHPSETEGFRNQGPQSMRCYWRLLRGGRHPSLSGLFTLQRLLRWGCSWGNNLCLRHAYGKV
jgi:hypothetical protein